MVPRNLGQCMTGAVQTEALYQFAEGVNLGRRTGPTPSNQLWYKS